MMDQDQNITKAIYLSILDEPSFIAMLVYQLIVINH